MQRYLRLLVVLLPAVSASAAAAIDLSRFNAVQVRLRTDFELTWVDTFYGGSQTTERADSLSYDTQDEDFKRGRFEGDTYTADWNEQITVSSGKIWKNHGSVSITLSATDPPAVSAFRLENYSDYPGSQFFEASTSSFLIEGPRTEMVIPLYQRTDDTLVFRVTGPTTCNAIAGLEVVYEYPQRTQGVVHRELIPPSTCASTGIQVFFEIDMWALPPISRTPTPPPTPPRTPTPGPDLVADNLEVVQAVQDLNNSIPLVANKRTFVRFHVHSTAGDTGRLPV